MIKHLKELWPTKRQYQQWSLPSKLTFIGAYVGGISLLVTIATLIATNINISLTKDVLEELKTVTNEKVVEGHFTSSIVKQKIKILWLKTKDAWEEDLQITFSEKSVFSSEIFGSIKYAAICKDRTTQLDHLIFIKNSGAATDVGHALFVYYDRINDRFDSKEFPHYGEIIDGYLEVLEERPKGWETWSIVKENDLFYAENGRFICNWTKKEISHDVIADIFKAIRPSKGNTYLDSIKQGEVFALPSRIIDIEIVKEILNNKKVEIDTYMENEKWKVILVSKENYSYIPNEGWDTWGVMLAYNNNTRKWISFYNVPKGTSGKVALYIPDKSEKHYPLAIIEKFKKKQSGHDDYLYLKLCVDCTWWGEFEDFLVKLNTMDIIRIGKITGVYPFGQKVEGELKPSTTIECKESFLVLTKGDEQCGFLINENSEVLFNGRVLAKDLIASHSSDGTTIAAKLLLVYPASNSQNYYFVNSCEFQENEKGYGLCWAPYIFNKKQWKLYGTYAGKYGPEEWIRWSHDDKFAIVYNRNEGAYWIHAINVNGGESYDYPQGRSRMNITKFAKDSFKWTGPRSFVIDIAYEEFDSNWKIVEETGIKSTTFHITPKGILKR